MVLQCEGGVKKCLLDVRLVDVVSKHTSNVADFIFCVFHRLASGLAEDILA